MVSEKNIGTNLVIHGKLFQGSKKASFFTGLEWVKKQCSEKLGFTPFPGTLNLEIKCSAEEYLQHVSDENFKELIPIDKKFCASKVLPVSIKDIKCALIQPEAKVNIHGNQVIEILAPVNLRKTLGLSDGDIVQVNMDCRNDSFGKKIRVEAVLFDLDGTLIDSIESYYQIVEIALEKLKFPQVSRKTILQAAKTDQFNWDMVLPDVPGQSGKETAQKAWNIIEQIYPDVFLNNVKPFPGTGNVIKKLHSNNIRIGIVTSTPEKNINDKMKILDIEKISDIIEIVISAGDVARKKPFPDPLILCKDRMGISADQCVYVGDMKMDIVAGKAAGMKTIAVLTGFESRQDLEEEEPDIIIDSISDLPKVLDLK